MPTLESLGSSIRERGLAYPETYEECPWGERVIKVRGKIFLFTSIHKGRLNVTVKLPASGAALLTRPCATPTGYGLGKSGWVSLAFEKAADVPMEEIVAWIDESFRTVAPKTLVKQLNGTVSAAPASSKKAATPRKPSTATSTTKKKKAMRGCIALVGGDSLRLERAARALQEEGFEPSPLGEPNPETLARIVRARPRAVVIDLGREAPQGLEFVRYLLDDVEPAVLLAFAGVRDAALDRKARATTNRIALCSRQAPGDPAFITSLCALF